MTQTLTCSQGHHWQADAASSDAATFVCPVCGAAPFLSTVTSEQPATSPPAAQLTVPGYEILGELGRGGMSIVYKARHLKLNRVVALKMLTAGAYAGPDLLQRFQREAESLARLTHPHIVQIHEAGWVEPQGPYLTLEYVEGGSLAQKLARTPQPPRQAAELVAVLARAVHFAHEHGVLHRDLKPGNVMLTADGTPKVADFGLARFLQTEIGASPDSPTPTGAVLGTPSYMAPEQAGGVTRAPTAAVDVYALGAVLYEMLTGRPPFLAEGPLETTLLVLTEDPVPPHRLRPRTPRDLETICLHCLRKNPRQRYPTAAALADDLQRYLDGRPIRVRPAGPVERLAKWARRRPAVAALLVVSAGALLLGLAGAGWYERRLSEKNAALTKTNGELEREKDVYNKLLVMSVDTVSDYGDAVDDAVSSLPESEAARRALLEKRLEFFDPFLRLAPDDPKLMHRKARGLFEVAKIHEKLGDATAAEAEFNEAVGLYEKAMADALDAPELRHDLGRTHIQLGGLLTGLGRRDEAARRYDLGVALLQGLIDEGRGDAAVRRDLATAYHEWAVLRMEQGRRPEAMDAFDRAVGLCETLVAEDGNNALYKVYLAEDRADRGGLHRVMGEADRGMADVDAALALLGQVAVDAQGRETYHDARASAHYHRGLLLAKSDPTAASKEFAAAAREYDLLRREFPIGPRYRYRAADTQLLMGRVAYVESHLAEAEAALRQADDLFGGLAGEWKDAPKFRAGRDESHYLLGMVLKLEGKTDEAARCFTDLVEWAPDDAEYQYELGIVTLNRAKSEEEMGATARRGTSVAGLTVLPNPFGSLGCLVSMLTHWRRADDLYRQAMRRLRFAEQSDSLTLDPTTRLAAARSRCLAARGLVRMGELLFDAEALENAGEALGDLADHWPSLFETNDAAKTYRLASVFSAEAMGTAYLDDRSPESERMSRVAAYAEETLRLLHRAVEKGYRDGAEMRASPWLKGLLNSTSPSLRKPREDLQKLLTDLDEKPRP